MAETIPSSFESDAEDDSDKKKGRKQKSSAVRMPVPLPVDHSPSGRSEHADEKPVKTPLQEAPKVFLDKLIGKPTETAVTPAEQQPEKGVEQAPAEHNTEVSVPPIAEVSEQTATYETAAEAEHNVAQDLADGAEISLQEIRQVPPARDEHIVAEALDIAAQAEQSTSEVEPEDTDEALSANTEIVPSAEVDITPPEDSKSAAEDSSAQTPGMPTAYMQTPRSTLNPFRTRPFTNRNRPVTPPVPPAPSASGLNGAGMPGAILASGSGGNVLPSPSYNVASPNYNATPNAQNPNVQRAVDDAEYEGRQRGRREGVLAGLLVGGGIEHFRHKRREKKLAKQHEKEMKAQEKRVERLESDYAVAREEQRVERTRAEAKLVSLQQTQEIERKEREKAAAEAKRSVEKEQAQIEEGLAIPKDHHVERSAWHNIEVDKSGKAVQESAFEYGHEYYKERAHEMTPSQQQQLDAAAGEVALVAAALSDTSVGASSQGQVQPKRQSDVSPRYEPEKVSTSARMLKTIATPPQTPTATLVWLIVLVTVLALILFISLAT